MCGRRAYTVWDHWAISLDLDRSKNTVMENAQIAVFATIAAAIAAMFMIRSSFRHSLLTMKATNETLKAVNEQLDEVLKAINEQLDAALKAVNEKKDTALQTEKLVSKLQAANESIRQALCKITRDG